MSALRSPHDLPAPSAELVLFRVHVQALITSLGRKRAEKYLRAYTDILGSEQALAEVLHLRPVLQEAEIAQARKEAAQWWRQALPLFVARIPRRGDR